MQKVSLIFPQYVLEFANTQHDHDESINRFTSNSWFMRNPLETPYSSQAFPKQIVNKGEITRFN